MRILRWQLLLRLWFGLGHIIKPQFFSITSFGRQMYSGTETSLFGFEAEFVTAFSLGSAEVPCVAGKVGSCCDWESDVLFFIVAAGEILQMIFGHFNFFVRLYGGFLGGHRLLDQFWLWHLGLFGLWLRSIL